jgi:AcrR family transcriptional regulator
MTTDASMPHWTGEAGDASRADATRERLIDAAAELFARRGYAGTSIRAVTQAAGVSVSAANYHFGSKRDLLVAVCRRRVAPMNETRLRALDALEARLGEQPPALEDLLRIFLEPACRQSPDGHRGAREVVARLYADPPEIVAELKRELFGPVRERMVSLLRRALPDATPEAVALAFQLTIGVMVHVVGGHLESGPDGDHPRDEALIEAVVAYSAAGMRARVAKVGASS